MQKTKRRMDDFSGLKESWSLPAGEAWLFWREVLHAWAEDLHIAGEAGDPTGYDWAEAHNSNVLHMVAAALHRFEQLRRTSGDAKEICRMGAACVAVQNAATRFMRERKPYELIYLEVVGSMLSVMKEKKQ